MKAFRTYHTVSYLKSRKVWLDLFLTGVLWISVLFVLAFFSSLAESVGNPPTFGFFFFLQQYFFWLFPLLHIVYIIPAQPEILMYILFLLGG